MAPNVTKEQEAAAILAKLNGLFEGDEGLPTVISRMKELEKQVEGLKGFNPKEAAEEFEKLKASHEAVVKAIRHSKRGLYVPGIEDEADRFSMLKTMIGVKTGNWKDAGREKEIIDSVRAKASQNIGSDNLGGSFVPDQVIPDVIAAIYTQSVFVGLEGSGTTSVSILDGLNGGNVKVPKFDGGLIAYWIGEEDEYAESNTTVGDISLNPKKLGVLVRVTDSMKKFAGYGFETLLRQDLVRAAAKKLDWTVAFGTGADNMPRGIVNHTGIKVYRAEDGTVLTQTQAAAVSDWQGGTLDFDGLDNMNLALEEDDIQLDSSSKKISCPRYFTYLRQLKTKNYNGQTDSQPYLLGLPMLSDARLQEMIGAYGKSTQITASGLPGASINGTTTSVTTKFTTVFGGNLNNIILGRWGGIEIDDDGGKGKGYTSDHTYMKLRLYADVGIRQERSIIICPDARTRA